MFIFFSSFCCVDDSYFPDPDTKPVVFVNQTDDLILVHAAESEESGLKSLFNSKADSKFISPGHAEIVSNYYYYRRGETPKKPLILYIIKQQTLDKHTINKIYEQNIYDEKRSLSFDELIGIDFKIIYN